MMLQDLFFDLLRRYDVESKVANVLWNELVDSYCSSSRYYHTMQHLENVLENLMHVKDKIRNWDAVLFSLFYHDSVYDASQNDNEEKSAELAQKRLLDVGVNEAFILLTTQLILATKSHAQLVNSDANYFTDADLAILGQPWAVYKNYYENIRKEYAMYSDAVYNEGRKKVLIQFMRRSRIFKTDFFIELYEAQARQNLQREVEIL
jgi:predicted metal-dependent HD superfamily phosphohydrolase